MSSIALFLSVKPQHAEKILNGIKTAEFRRTKPRVKSGDTIYIYVSSPTKALMGYCKVDKVISGTPDEIWNNVSSVSGLTHSEFTNYYKGTQRCFVMLLEKVVKLHTSISLSSLKMELINFTAPQIYRYLSPDEIEKIHYLFEHY